MVELGILIITMGISIYALVHIPLDILMIYRRDRTIPLSTYDVEQPNLMNSILGISSILMWMSWLSMVLYQQVILPITLPKYVYYIGYFIFSSGILIACWSRILRGINSPSWGLNETIPLVTKGPYSVVRHPTYLFYLLMFIGIPLTTGSLVLLILTPGFLGYVFAIDAEEELLEKHFKDQFLNYKKFTKKIIPFIW